MTKFSNLLDWVAAGSPAPPPHQVKIATILRYMQDYRLNNFVETGTFRGTTTRAVAETGARVTTIELGRELYEDAVKLFAGMSNVTCVLGDSAERLQDILADLKEPALLWLDGHYSGGPTARGKRLTPIVEEVFAVYRNRNVPHVMLIDDARLFKEEPTGDYPSLSQLRTVCEMLFPGCDFSVAHDIIRVVPSGARPATAIQ